MDVIFALIYIMSQLSVFILIILTFYKWQTRVDTAIHITANIVRHGNNEKESELAMSSMSSISGSETNDWNL